MNQGRVVVVDSLSDKADRRTEEERWLDELARLNSTSHELTPRGLDPFMRHLFKPTRERFTRRAWFGVLLYPYALEWWETLGGLRVPAPLSSDDVPCWGVGFDRVPHRGPADGP